jgi:hypothetical protein
MNDIERLFSSIVLVGLSAGCGGGLAPGEEDGGSGGVTASDSGGTSSGGVGSEGVGSEAGVSGGAGSGGAGSGGTSSDRASGGTLVVTEGINPDSCENPAQFHCDEDRCFCDSEAPQGPDDCEDPLTFTCEELEPWTGCSCTAATSAEVEECESVGVGVTCQSEEPRFGCECRIFVIK